MSRVYLPLTIEGLTEAHRSGTVTVPDEVILAVDDDEESEYAALMTAADLAAALLEGPGRRVVLVAELTREPEPGESVPRKRWVAVHADVADRPTDADPDEDLAWFATQEIEDLR